VKVTHRSGGSRPDSSHRIQVPGCRPTGNGLLGCVILNRVQESRARLDTEIRKLLHEVSRIAEQALACAKKVREEGMLAVEAELRRLDSLVPEVHVFGCA
jgi:hypothetical protein